MPAHKSFSVAERDHEAKGPTFDLGAETFHCLPAMPAGAFMDLPDTLAGQIVVAGEFIWGCLVPEDEDRFRAVLHSKSHIVEPFELMPVLRWLLNEAWLPDAPPAAPAPPPEG